MVVLDKEWHEPISLGNVEHSSPVCVLRGADEWDGLYVSSRAYMQVINHLEQRAAGSSPGHGIRMQTCSNLARTFRRCTTSPREGECTGREDRPLRGGQRMDTQLLLQFPPSSCPRRRAITSPFEPGSRLSTGWSNVVVEWGVHVALPRASGSRTGRDGPEQPEGLLWQQHVGSPIELDGTRG